MVSSGEGREETDLDFLHVGPVQYFLTCQETPGPKFPRHSTHPFSPISFLLPSFPLGHGVVLFLCSSALHPC